MGSAPGATLLTTFTNPAPALNAWFGNSVAPLGNDRVLIGAYAAGPGKAYLYSTGGTLLAVFTNPSPASSYLFGRDLVAVGDRVLVSSVSDDTGAGDTGAVHVFSTNGTLLTTITNPTPAPAEWFGYSLAAVGSDRVVIGRAHGATPETDPGAAYLFTASGTLLSTFTNPVPTEVDSFGSVVAALDHDRVLVAALANDTGATNAGIAYLFNANGTLLTKFTNPTPAFADRFGNAMSSVGNDRVLIAAYSDDTGGSDAGAAYLFDTNGVLLTTFTNPVPPVRYFGFSVAAVGNDQVLIGAATASPPGMAHLFSTGGILQMSFTCPAPNSNDEFGHAVAAVGDSRVLIGDAFDDPGAVNAGAAYLFNILPKLAVRPTNTNSVAVSWPSPSTGFTLQKCSNGFMNWSSVTDPVQDDGTNRTLIVTQPTGSQFFRLIKP